MTTVPVHPTPAVELRFHPTDLDAETLRTALKPLGSPSEAIEAALMTARLMVITQAKAEVAAMTGEMSAAKLIGFADLAWQIYAPKFVRSLGPVFAEQYLHAMKAAGAGDIPMATVYALAEQHASRVGTYYHESSRDALAQGFNTFVNRRITERVAADRVLDGYGLTGRGMSGYTSRSLDKAATVTPLRLKERVLDYIGTSVRRRSKVFATQEQHNISQQAQQIAWMWLQDHGKISPNSQKIWITARDERVCPQCGPMHGVKVLLGERFKLPNGTEVWVPGMHPNCRCQVRLLSHPWMAEVGKAHSSFGVIAKADEWNPTLHPRGGDPVNPGRFSARARTARQPEVAEKEPVDTTKIQEMLDAAEHQRALEAVLDPPIEPKATLEPRETRATLEPREPRATLASSVKATLASRVTPERPTLAAPEKPELGQRSQAVLPTREKAQLRVPEQAWLGQAEQAFLRYDQRTKRVPRVPEPNKRRRRKTVPILDAQGKPIPVYYVASRFEMDESGYIEPHDEMEFTADRQTAVIMAQQVFDQEINDTAESINDNAENKITQVFGDGRKFEATIDGDETYSVVGWAAYQDQITDPDWTGDRSIKVLWREVDADDMPVEDGEEYADSVRISDVAEEWHLDADRFAVKVLVLTEGHKSERGNTWQANFKDRHGYDSWITTGRYKMNDVLQDREDRPDPVQFAELEPDDPVIVDEDEPGVGWSPEHGPTEWL
jgi:hypothetical protein